VEEQVVCADKLVQGEVAALLGKVFGQTHYMDFDFAAAAFFATSNNHSTLNNFSSALFLMPPPSPSLSEQLVAEFLNSCSPVLLLRCRLSHRPPPSSSLLLLPQRLCRKFLRRIL
jgi:hypothetical protein